VAILSAIMVATIVDDTLYIHLALTDLTVDPPAFWDEQRVRIAGTTSA